MQYSFHAETKESDVYTSILTNHWEKCATLSLDNVCPNYDIDYRKLKLEVQEATKSSIYNKLYEKIIKQKPYEINIKLKFYSLDTRYIYKVYKQ